MIRDVVRQGLPHCCTLDEVVYEEMKARGFNLKGDLWVNRLYPDETISHRCAVHMFTIKCDNYNDGFDAGLEWCKMAIDKAENEKEAKEIIDQELNTN